MKFLFIAVSIMTLAASPALAHHSQVMFDRNKEVTIDGVVKDFSWANPHGWTRILVPDAAGGLPKEWVVEMPPAAALARGGWTNHTLKPGDKIVMKIYPLASGAIGGTYKQVTLPDGKVLGQRQPGAAVPQ